MAGIPFLLVRVVRSLDCRLAAFWPMVKFLSEMFFEIVTSRAGPSCFRFAGLNQSSTEISFDCLSALRSLMGGLVEAIMVPFRISIEPAVRWIFLIVVMCKSSGGLSLALSFTTEPSTSLKSYNATSPLTARSAPCAANEAIRIMAEICLIRSVVSR